LSDSLPRGQRRTVLQPDHGWSEESPGNLARWRYPQPDEKALARIPTATESGTGAGIARAGEYRHPDRPEGDLNHAAIAKAAGANTTSTRTTALATTNSRRA